MGNRVHFKTFLLLIGSLLGVKFGSFRAMIVTDPCTETEVFY